MEITEQKSDNSINNRWFSDCKLWKKELKRGRICFHLTLNIIISFFWLICPTNKDPTIDFMSQSFGDKNHWFSFSSFFNLQNWPLVTTITKVKKPITIEIKLRDITSRIYVYYSCSSSYISTYTWINNKMYIHNILL